MICMYIDPMSLSLHCRPSWLGQEEAASKRLLMEEHRSEEEKLRSDHTSALKGMERAYEVSSLNYFCTVWLPSHRLDIPFNL